MPSFKKPGSSAAFEKVKGGRYLREMLFLNSFSFEDKEPRFTRLKPDLALRLCSKGQFYIWAMYLRFIIWTKILITSHCVAHVLKALATMTKIGKMPQCV